MNIHELANLVAMADAGPAALAVILQVLRLETEHGVTNQAEDQRRTQRTEAAAQKCAAAGQLLSTLVLQARRATQRSVKFVRWIRQSIRDQAAEATAVLRLKALYAIS